MDSAADGGVRRKIGQARRREGVGRLLARHEDTRMADEGAVEAGGATATSSHQEEGRFSVRVAHACGFLASTAE